MFPPLKLIRCIGLVFTCFSGNIINVPVTLMYLSQWKTSGNPAVYDKFLFSIVLTNVFLQSFMTIDGLFEVFSVLGETVYLSLFYLQFTLFCVSAWNTAWLSMFYYLRLVNSSNSLLMKMKTQFVSSAPQIIMGSIFSSGAINLGIFWSLKITVFHNRTIKEGMRDYGVSLNPVFTMFSSHVEFLLPFILTCLSIGGCVTILLRHVHSINLSDSNLTSSQLQGHIQAVKSLIGRVLLDLCFFVTVFECVVTSFRVRSIYEGSSWLIVLFYPTAQSLILIYGNPKLRNKMFRKITFTYKNAFFTNKLQTPELQI